MKPTSRAQIVLCTCPADGTATKLAKTLVECRLAACVNVVEAVKSVYRWQGQVVEDGESLLVIKTTAERFQALEEIILAEHPYELPEIVAVPIEQGLAPYLTWLDAETTSSDQ